jgi:hypothetical protein
MSKKARHLLRGDAGPEVLADIASIFTCRACARQRSDVTMRL